MPIIWHLRGYYIPKTSLFRPHAHFYIILGIQIPSHVKPMISNVIVLFCFSLNVLLHSNAHSVGTPHTFHRRRSLHILFYPPYQKLAMNVEATGNNRCQSVRDEVA